MEPNSEEQPKTALQEPIPEEEVSEKTRRRGWLWQGKIGPAFWTVTGILSLGVNIVLLAVLIALGRQLFTIKNVVSDPLILGLHSNFIKMDSAHILTSVIVSDTIKVQDTIPVVFDLPLKENTTVVLIDDTPIAKTTVYLNGVGVPTNIVLPKGTPLKIALDLVVPVKQQVPVTLNVPVKLNVPVDIPLEQTELHEPFIGLRQVVEPYQIISSQLPASPEDVPNCGKWTNWFCELFFVK
jgi:hypothetical protein